MIQHDSRLFFASIQAFCRLVRYGVLCWVFLGGGMPFCAWSSEEPIPPHVWSFQGIRGTFDRGALQRGFQVYKEVCSACHGLSRVRYRNLQALGYTTAQIKTLAAEARVVDAHPDREGMPVERAGLASDGLHNPYPTEEAARQANQGALPPDLSLIVKARKGGSDYVYALLTGYVPPPSGFVLQTGLHYNKVFSGHQIAMTAPLAEGQVAYGDGTAPTVAQMAEDVTTFLAWAAEPELESRKQMGVKVIMYLSILTVLLFLLMRRVWSRLSESLQ